MIILSTRRKGEGWKYIGGMGTAEKRFWRFWGLVRCRMR
jgi:hypothetical protein